MWQAHGVFNPPPQSCYIVLISRIMGIIRIEPFPVDLCADPMPQKAVPLETGHPGIPVSIVVTIEFAYRKHPAAWVWISIATDDEGVYGTLLVCGSALFYLEGRAT